MLFGQFPLMDEAGKRTDSREINVNHHINRLYAEWCLMRIIPEEVDEDTGVVVVERRLDRIDPSFIPVGRA
ncbi:hypothetical protein [Vibrio phage YC]|uniref:Uncharacterized protein n=1 Tax=Vibrio phage YC TaxID=2267403 RepID=A0A384ZSE3_9CAUD|nr:hypothetical protein HWB64_gp189 [Vibrio phage YC]AXC34558.1 hypothetical protein [Vibrio phage YC]